MVQDVIRLELGFVNAYLLGGPRSTVLVDTGLSMQWEALLRGLEAAGCEASRLKLVILTHADPDHAGNCRRLQSEFHLPIAVHSADAEALETGLAPARKIRGLFKRALFALMNFRRKLRGGKPNSQAFKPDILLEDGAELSAWGVDARVVHLPGHTRGSIAILTESGAVIAGDVVSNRKAPAVSPFVENADQYRASIGRLKAEAAGMDTVYPGHGRPFPAGDLSGISF